MSKADLTEALETAKVELYLWEYRVTKPSNLAFLITDGDGQETVERSHLPEKVFNSLRFSTLTHLRIFVDMLEDRLDGYKL